MAKYKVVFLGPEDDSLEYEKAEMADLDVEFQKALETSSDTTAIVAKKQALRDAPAASAIGSAANTDELKAQWDTTNLGASPYS